MGFFRALGLFGQAIGLLARDPALRRWTAISAAVSLLCFIGLAVGLWFLVPDALAAAWPRPGAWSAEAYFWYPALVVIYIISFAIGALTLPLIVLAPVSDRISVATERALDKTPPNGSFVEETARSLGKAALRVGILLAGHVVLLLLWAFPGAGHAAWTIGSALWSMAWLAFEYVDVTANRHGLKFRQVIDLLNKNGPGAMGVGLVIWALLWVPILNVFFVPVAVVTAALYFHGANGSA